MKHAGRLRAGALGLLALAGCASGGVRPEELPSDPIVFVYRTPEQGRRRADALRDARKEQRPRSEGVARLEDVQGFLGQARTPVPMEFMGQASLLDPHTGTRTPLEALPRGAEAVGFGPGRKRFVFFVTRPDLASVEVKEFDLATGQVLPIAAGGTPILGAAIGPEGRVALVSAQGGQELKTRLVLRTPGADPVPLTPGPLDRQPVWSPDGRVLAYVSRAPDGGEAIAVVRFADDGRPAEPRVVARGNSPAFTPDGAWIVYSARTADGLRLWRTRPDGSGRTPLGEGTTDELDPAVSPDGGFVAYVSEQNDRQELRVRRFDGSGDTPLIDDGDGAAPIW